MRIKTNIVKLLAVLAILGSLVAVAAVPAAALNAGPCPGSAGSPQVVWSAPSAYPGQSITGQGSGFTQLANIIVTIGGVTLTPAATVIVQDGSAQYPGTPGTWNGSFTIPDMPGGDYKTSLGNGLVATDTALSACADFTVTPKAKASPTVAGVGTTVTVSGRGYTYPGTATALLYESDGVTAAGMLITSPFPISINSNGSLSATFAMPEPLQKDPSGNYLIKVTDSAGKTSSASITLTPSIQLIPSSGLPGQSFTVQGNDFPAGTAYIYWQAYVNGGQLTTHAITNGSFIASTTIPSTALVGQFYVVAVQGSGAPTATNSAKALITVGVLTLTLTPGSAVAGTTVTLQGSGFTPGYHLNTVVFGSVVAPITGPTEIPASGAITTTIVVPPLNPGTYTVVATDTNNVVRTGSWSVATPTVTLNPSAGPVSTLVTVNGSGWIPTTNAMTYSITSTVAVTMAGQTYTTPVSSSGKFSIALLVPGAATSGPNTVLIQDNVIAGWAASPSNFSAVATFTVASASITLSPNQGVAGQAVTFTGVGFPAYSQIVEVDFNQDIGTTYIVPVPFPQIDANGSVTGTFNVPASISGTATVVIWSKDFGSAGAATFNIVSGAAAPAAVFASLITNNQLAMPVWSFDNASKTWLMYDPNDLADSSITLLTPGAIYWINVNANVTLTWGINTYTLTPGWNGIGWLG